METATDRVIANMVGRKLPEKPPSKVCKLLNQRKTRAAVLAAIAAGIFEEEALTDILFLHRYPGRDKPLIQRSEPNAHNMASEWLQIRKRWVRPALLKHAPPAKEEVQKAERPPLIELIKKETLDKLSKKIEQLDSKALESDNLSRKLHNEFKIEPPMLLTSKIDITLGKGKAATNGSPPGGSFFGQPENRKVQFKSQQFPFPYSNKPSKGFPAGQVLYFALFTVPIEGSYELFTRILKGHPWNENFRHESGRVIFRSISSVPIIENGPLINKMKMQAGHRFKEIENLLNQFINKADAVDLDQKKVDFDQKTVNKEIKVEISNLVEKEKSKRTTQKSTEATLNPYPKNKTTQSSSPPNTPAPNGP